MSTMFSSKSWGGAVEPPRRAIRTFCRTPGTAARYDAATATLAPMTDYLSQLFSLDGRTALVTGGSSGIGLGMARALAGAGARTVILARDPERLTEAATAIEADGGEAAWFSADLADRAAIAEAAGEITEAHGEPDILVNCAGINLRPPLGELTEADWDLTEPAWDRPGGVTLPAPFLPGRRSGPARAPRGWGRIINVTSQQAGRA